MIHLLVHSLQQLGLLVLVVAAAFGFGALALDRLRLGDISAVERWLFAQLLGLGVLSFVMLGLGVLQLYYPLVGWIVVAVGCGIALIKARSLLNHRFPALPRLPTLDAIIVALLVLIVLLTLGYTLLVNALTPPVSYDAVAYHLAIPKLYIAAHRIFYIPYIVYSNWPLGTEMLFTLALLLGSEALAQLITWWFAVLIGLGLAMFAGCRLPRWSGPLAAAIFFSIPMLAMLAGTGLIEVPLAGYTFFAFYAFWRYHETDARGWMIASALLAGLAATTKLNGAATAIVIAGVGLVVELVSRRPSHALHFFVVYGSISFLVASPWYLKSWILTGNPLWPFLQPPFAGRDWDALGSEYLLGYIRSINLAPTPRNWLLALWYLTTDGAKFGSFFIGPYLLAFMPLAVLPAINQRRWRPLLGALALTGIGLYSVWFLLTHQTRFLMPATPVMALLAAAGIAWLWAVRIGVLRWTVRAAVIAWLIAGSWVFNSARRGDWQRSLPYLTGQIDRDTYLTSVFEDYPAFEYVNTALPPDAIVLLAPFEARGYYLDRRYIWLNPISQRYIRIEQFPDAAAFNDHLQRLGVTHILLNTRYTFPQIRYAERQEALLNGLIKVYGHLVFASAQSQLYELRPAAGSAPSVIAPSSN